MEDSKTVYCDINVDLEINSSVACGSPMILMKTLCGHTVLCFLYFSSKRESLRAFGGIAVFSISKQLFQVAKFILSLHTGTIAQSIH